TYSAGTKPVPTRTPTATRSGPSWSLHVGTARVLYKRHCAIGDSTTARALGTPWRRSSRFGALSLPAADPAGTKPVPPPTPSRPIPSRPTPFGPSRSHPIPNSPHVVGDHQPVIPRLSRPATPEPLRSASRLFHHLRGPINDDVSAPRHSL